MDSRTNELERHRYTLVKLENAIKLVRPCNFVRRHTPGKAADSTEMLAFRQKCLTAPQIPLRLVAFSDIAQVPGERRRPVQWDARDCKFAGDFAAVSA